MLENLIFSRHLEDHEEILFTARQHQILLWLRMILPTITFIIIPAIFMNIISPTIIIMFWIVGAIILFHRYMQWYNYAWLFTNQHILLVKWGGFFNNKSSSINYSEVGTVDYAIRGVCSSLCNYGTITFETLSDSRSMTHCAKPMYVQKAMQKIKKSLTDGAPADNSAEDLASFKRVLQKIVKKSRFKK